MLLFLPDVLQMDVVILARNRWRVGNDAALSQKVLRKPYCGVSSSPVVVETEVDAPDIWTVGQILVQRPCRQAAKGR